MINPMKDSGVEWIGKIPRDWEISKIKYTTKLNGRIGWQGLTSSEYQDEGPFLITGTDFLEGRINFESAVHIDERRWEEAKQIQVENGDLLITKDGTVGKVAIIDGLDDKASLNSGVLRIQTTNEVNRKFLYYVLLSEEFWLWFNYTNSGASTILHLYQNVFEKFTYVIPPLQEQKAIANFLDEETKKLDDTKSLLQQQIEKLKDYRKSLIWETVTKGLDKTVPMKDSGTDWIGEIPEDWEVKRLKYIFIFQNGYAFSSSEMISEKTEANIIRIGDFTEKGVDFENSLSFQHGIDLTLNLFEIRKNQILIAMSGATVGKIAYIMNEPNTTSYINQRVGIIYSDYNRYIYYWLSAGSFIDYIYLNANGSAQPNISSGQIGEFDIPFPPTENQISIINFLDKKSKMINQIIDNKQSQIEVIDKQKKTLIYDYVTGKRRVI